MIKLYQNQHQSTSININQHQSTSININQHQSTSININQHQSTSININQHQSTSININQHQSTSININQHQSTSILTSILTPTPLRFGRRCRSQPPVASSVVVGETAPSKATWPTPEILTGWFLREWGKDLSISIVTTNGGRIYKYLWWSIIATRMVLSRAWGKDL